MSVSEGQPVLTPETLRQYALQASYDYSAVGVIVESHEFLRAELAREREARQEAESTSVAYAEERARAEAAEGRVRELQGWIERWSHADPMPSWFEDEVTAALAGESVEALVGLPE